MLALKGRLDLDIVWVVALGMGWVQEIRRLGVALVDLELLLAWFDSLRFCVSFLYMEFRV